MGGGGCRVWSLGHKLTLKYFKLQNLPLLAGKMFGAFNIGT